MHASTRRQLQRQLAALADGDRRAFDDVFALSWPVMRQLAVRLLGDASEAEDAAQRALLQLFSKASCFDPKREALPWMLTFVINECRTVRTRRRRRPMAELTAEPAGDAGPEEHLVRADLVRAVQDVVGVLGHEDHVALGLVEPTDDAPAPATRRKRKQRALGRLRSAWRRIHGVA